MPINDDEKRERIRAFIKKVMPEKKLITNEECDVAITVIYRFVIPLLQRREGSFKHWSEDQISDAIMTIEGGEISFDETLKNLRDFSDPKCPGVIMPKSPDDPDVEDFLEQMRRWAESTRSTAIGDQAEVSENAAGGQLAQDTAESASELEDQADKGFEDWAQ